MRNARHLAPLAGASLLSVLAVACHGSAEPSTPSSSSAATAAPASASTPIDGKWVGNWGDVQIDGETGTYSQTFSGGVGNMNLRHTSDGSYEGTWGESDARHGTMTIELGSDGRSITGQWAPDPDVTVGTKEGGTIEWTRP